MAGFGSPVWDARVITDLEGIARTVGAAPAKKVALLRDPLLAALARIDVETSSGLRDRAHLVVGFALGLRRSEFVGLTIEDLSPAADGILVLVRRGATTVRRAGAALVA